MMNKFFFSLLLLAHAFFGLAQQEVLRFASANVTVTAPPANLNASDGVYDKFVLIRWEPSDKVGEYRLFRALSPNGGSMIELTKKWQNSTWFCDYSAEKGRDYFYAVMGTDGKSTSALSPFDKGFLRKDDPIAQDESLSEVSQERYAAPKMVFMLVENVMTDLDTLVSGTAAMVKVALQNVFDEATTRTDVRVYLSKDTTWDFDDPLLLSKTYSSFPANTKVTLAEQFALNEMVVSGEYFLIVVVAPTGDILNAKTGFTQINIKKP